MENAFPDYQRYMQMWMDFAGKLASAGTTASTESVPVDAARHMREAYLRSLGEYTEEFMRTPQFAEMMKQSTSTAINLCKQANDMMTQAHHAMGGVARSDVDGLLDSIRRCETRVLERLEQISARLDELENRVSKQENARGGRSAAKPNNGKTKQVR